MIPAMGAHCCHLAEACNLIPMRIASVTPAKTGAAALGASSGTSDSLLRTIVITVAAMSISTVPATTGVITRRSRERREIKRNCTRAETTMRVESIAGPAVTSAETHIAMNALVETTLIEYPEPSLQIRRI